MEQKEEHLEMELIYQNQISNISCQSGQPVVPEYWTQLFHKIDVNNDKKITFRELQKHFKENTSQTENISNETIKRILEESDEDGSGFIDLKEFKRMYWKQCFNYYDKNKDGKISKEEFKNLMTDPCFKKNIPEKFREELHELADKDGNGVLDYKEFIKLVESKKFQVLLSFFHEYVNTVVIQPRERAKRDNEQYFRLKYGMLIVSGFEHLMKGTKLPEMLCNIYNLFFLCICLFYLFNIIEFLFHLINLAHYNVAQALIYNPYKRGEIWRWVSYMFVHIGWGHLSVNLVVQLLLGLPLEMVHGSIRVMSVYILGVISGSLITSITDISAFLAGASGGVYALLFAHLSSLFMNWKEMIYRRYHLLVLVLLISYDLIVAAYYRYFSHGSDKTGYAAHFGGAGAGLLLGFNILFNFKVSEWEKKVHKISVGIFCTIFVSVILVNIFCFSCFKH